MAGGTIGPNAVPHAPPQTTADLVAELEREAAAIHDELPKPFHAALVADLLTRAADALRAKEKRQAEAEEGERRAHMELSAVTMALAPMRATLLDPPDGGNVRLGEQVARLVAAYRTLHAGRVGSGEVEVEGVVVMRYLDDDGPETENVIVTDLPVSTRVRVTALPKEAE